MLFVQHFAANLTPHPVPVVPYTDHYGLIMQTAAYPYAKPHMFAATRRRRARGGNRLTNQVSNEEILRGSTPLCLAERLAEIYSLFRIVGYVFDFVVPPHGTNPLFLYVFNCPSVTLSTFKRYKICPSMS